METLNPYGNSDDISFRSPWWHKRKSIKRRRGLVLLAVLAGVLLMVFLGSP
ncbi:MAG: hypothetical protein ACYTDT_10090 [Planctomycetota bacterium]